MVQSELNKVYFHRLAKFGIEEFCMEGDILTSLKWVVVIHNNSRMQLAGKKREAFFRKIL